MKRFFLIAIAGLMMSGNVIFAEDGLDNTEHLIIIPKACGLNYGEYNIAFRVYNKGGLMTRAVFGVMQGLNVGFSWDLNELIGTGTIRGRSPELYLKLDLFREGPIMPGISLGYDAQGYDWDRDRKEYSTPPIGFFLVLTKELILPNLYFTLGSNYDTEDNNSNHDFFDKLTGFTGINYQPGKFGIYYEALNVGKGSNVTWMNIGAKYEIVEGLQFMLAFENFSEARELSSGQQRTFSILYRGAF